MADDMEVLQHEVGGPQTQHAVVDMQTLQVVSDIDDTLMCSGGFWPAGRDTRYPKKCMYPGALTFYSELDIGYKTKIQVSAPRNNPMEVCNMFFY